MQRESASNYLKDNFPILLILILGFVLRVYDLGAESLWFDEVFSIEMARLSLVDIMKFIAFEGENHPPIYYMIMHYWVALIGDSEVATRLFSTLIGTISIFIIYKVGKILFNKNVGLIGALILAVSVFQIKYSQEVRAYSLMSFLTLLSVYFFLRVLSKGDLKYSIGYTLSSILLIYTHYFGSLIIVAQNFYFFSLLLLDHDKSNQFGLKRWIVLQLVLVFFSLPELLLLKGATALQEDFWIPKPNIKGVIGIFLKFSGSIPLLIIFSMLAIYAVINSGLLIWKKRFGELRISHHTYSNNLNLSQVSRIYLLIVLALIPVVLPFIYSQFKTPIFIDRYMIGASVAFYLLAAIGIDSIVSKRLKMGLIVLIGVISMFYVVQYYHTIDKDQWREAMEYIEDNAGPGESILVHPDHVLIAAQYYLKRKDLMLLPIPDDSEMNFNISNNIWIILSAHGEKYHYGKETFSQKNNIVKEKELERLKLYQFSQKVK